MARANIQLSGGLAVAGKRRGRDDDATWMARRLVAKRAAQGTPKGKGTEEQIAACRAVYEARRRLWQVAMAFDHKVLAAIFRARADDGDDYSNRKGIENLRLAIAAWLEGPNSKAGRTKWLAGKKAERAGQMPMFFPEDWPTLSPDNAKSVARAWPHVDLIADRDGQVILEASAKSRVKEVAAARRRFDRALSEAIAWNGALVVATARKFHVGDGMTITMADILAAGQDGLCRGLMDYQPSVAKPSTHLVTWIAQRMRKCLENAHLIHVPVWVRDTVNALKRGSPLWREADKQRRLAEAEARRAGLHDGLIAEAGQRARATALKGKDPLEVIPRIDPKALADALLEVEAGISSERAEEILVDLGLDHACAVAAAARLTRDRWAIVYDEVITGEIRGPGRQATVDELLAMMAGEDRCLALLGPLVEHLDIKPASMLKALRETAHRVESLDRPPGNDDGSRHGAAEPERPREVAVRPDDNDASLDEEIEAREQGAILREAIGELAKVNCQGCEQAEVLRRLYGLNGPEETIIQIAASPLQSTSRKIGRNVVGDLKRAGEAWLRQHLAGEVEASP